MKCVLFMILAFATAGIYGPQEGVVAHEEKMDLHRRLPPDRQELKSMIPQFRISNYKLLYKDQLTMYTASKVQQSQAFQGRQGGGCFSMQVGQTNRQVYKNMEENVMVDSREFMTKMFLINAIIDDREWKITDGQKQILDMLCLKANYSDSSTKYYCLVYTANSIGFRSW